MKKSTLFLTGMAALLLSFGLVLAGCSTDGDEGGNGDEPLPSPVGENELSGKTYFDFEDKIMFVADGTYKVYSVNYNEGSPVLNNGKYAYAETEIGTYSWNADAKTVTTKPEKIAIYDENGYVALQNTAEYRAAVQEMLNAYKEEMGEAAFNAKLAEMGFSSAAAYIDYDVAEAFKNVTRNYAFSTDNKALFLDEELPANKGTNELSGETYTQNGGSSTTYVFTVNQCTVTYSGGGSSVTYTYAYDSNEKRVYLKRPTTGRASAYTGASANTTTAGYFVTADEYNAAQVNSMYNISRYMYNTTGKTLG